MADYKGLSKEAFARIKEQRNQIHINPVNQGGDMADDIYNHMRKNDIKTKDKSKIEIKTDTE